MTMKPIDWQSAYGPASDRLRGVVSDALRTQAPAARPRRAAFAVLVALLCILLACTALAVAGHFGLLGSWQSYDPEKSGDASGMISGTLPLAGDPLASVDLAVAEAFYDGHSARFLLSAAHSDAGVALLSPWQGETSDAYDEALLRGDIPLTLDIEAIAPGTMRDFPSIFLSQTAASGRDMSLVFTHHLTEGAQPDPLPITFTCALRNVQTGEILQTGEFSFAIPKTADPQTLHFTPGRDMESIHLESVELSYTPLETTLILRYRPLYKLSAEFGLVGEDGIVLPLQAHLYAWGENTADDTIVRMILPSTGPLPDKIPLWVFGADEVIVLHTQTQAVTRHPATYRGVEMPQLPSGTQYSGAQGHHIEYDEEVFL